MTAFNSQDSSHAGIKKSEDSSAESRGGNLGFSENTEDFEQPKSSQTPNLGQKGDEDKSKEKGIKEEEESIHQYPSVISQNFAQEGKSPITNTFKEGQERKVRIERTQNAQQVKGKGRKRGRSKSRRRPIFVSAAKLEDEIER